MMNAIVATVVFVQDIAKCTTFYRDTLKLPYAGSDVNSSTFLLQERYLILLSVSGAADPPVGSRSMELLVSFWPLELRMSMPHMRYSRQRELHSSDLQPTSPGGYALRTLPIQKATSGRSINP